MFEKEQKELDDLSFSYTFEYNRLTGKNIVDCEQLKVINNIFDNLWHKAHKYRKALLDCVELFGIHEAKLALMTEEELDQQEVIDLAKYIIDELDKEVELQIEDRQLDNRDTLIILESINKHIVESIAVYKRKMEPF